MNTTAILLIIAAVVVLAAVGWLLYRQQRMRRLKSRFGPEYNETVRQFGSETRAQNALEARARRMEKIHIRSLSHESYEQFASRWQNVQRRFVDDPAGSIREADTLVTELMVARGYPVSDFEQRAEDVSVDHPHVVRNYRMAHAIAERHSRSEAGTEDLRQALVHYRELFDDLLEVQPTRETRLRR
jgi:hypothetical protein